MPETDTLPAAVDVEPVDRLVCESFDLQLAEATAGDPFNADGTIDMVLIRPCNGRGVGARIYEAAMLERDAGVYAGWPMFDNHDSPQAKKARAGLPRAPSELSGEIRESFWDAAFTHPDDGKFGYGPGAVIGRCMLTDDMEALVRKIPSVIRTSVNGMATNLRKGSRAGRAGWVVEGMVNDPENSSVDLVTKAGAGGRVRQVLESVYDRSNEPIGRTAIEDLTDENLTSWLSEHRPHVTVTAPTPTTPESPMNVQEALQSDEVRSFIGAQVQEALAEQRETMRDEIREEIQQELGQTSRLRGLASHARTLIEAARLPEHAKVGLREDYGVEDRDDDTVVPGRHLALIEAEVDDQGEITTSARDVLAASIDSDVTRARNLLRESAPTVPMAPGVGSDSQPGGDQQKVVFGGSDSAWANRIRESGMDPATFGATPVPAGD